MGQRWFAVVATIIILIVASTAALAQQQEQDSNDSGSLLTDYEFTAGQAERFDYIEGGLVAGLEQDAPYGTRTVRDAGPYDGWDVFLTDQYEPTRTLSTNNWITLHLSQPATVAIIWQAYEPLPAWLSDWERVGEPVVIEDSQSPKSRVVLERDFDAGEVTLGAVYADNEDGGQRSPYMVAVNESGEATDPESTSTATPDPTPEPTVEPTPEPTDEPTGSLLTDYEFTAGQAERFDYIEGGLVAGLEQDAPYGTRTVRDAGPYDGWDVFLTDQYEPTRTLATNNWITLHLSQPATVAVIWQADEPLPAWLSDWERVGDPVVIEDSQSPKSRVVLERDFDAGEVTLGAVYGDGESGIQRSPYMVAINESGEATDPEPTSTPTPDPTPEPTPEPTATPEDPEGEEPVAGEECPAWVHDQYTTEGPDGETYPTWHPAIDAEYGCHFGHEHGSNPERVEGARAPSYGLATPHEPHDMTESHYGFKTKALNAEDGVQILATTHFGTAEPQGAVCQRYHWANVQFVQHGELVADLTFMGDFGAARKNDTNEPLDRSCVNPRTGETQSQHEIAQESYGVRLNPVCTGPTNSDCGPFYYPWRMTTPNASQVLGFYSQAYTVNTPTVVAACEDMTCTERRVIGGVGAWAFVSFDQDFGVRDNGNNGVFYTNIFGDELRNSDDHDAVRQYVKPGVDIRLDNLSDQTSYFPDSRHGGTHGDYTYTQMYNGDDNIMGNVRSVVDPEGVISDYN